MNKPTYYPGLQILRGVAALLVVFQHSVFIALTANGEAYNNEFPVNYGRFGVVLFFSISGFVIALNRKSPVIEFIINRVARIYPSYWAAIIATYVLMFLASKSCSLSGTALFLFPDTKDANLPIPYWTLIFEIAFYAIASVCIFAKIGDRGITVLCVCWIVYINVAGQQADITNFSFPGWNVFRSPIMQVLPMGVLAGIHFDGLRRFLRPMHLLIVAVACYAASFSFVDFSSERHLFLGLCTTAIAIAAADKPTNRIAAHLGAASYAIYLLHLPAMIFATAWFKHFPVILGVFYCFLIGTVAGLLFFEVDKRVHKTAKQWL